MKINLLDKDAYVQGPPHDQLRWLCENNRVHWHPEPDGAGF